MKVLVTPGVFCIYSGREVNTRRVVVRLKIDRWMAQFVHCYSSSGKFSANLRENFTERSY